MNDTSPYTAQITTINSTTFLCIPVNMVNMVYIVVDFTLFFINCELAFVLFVHAILLKAERIISSIHGSTRDMGPQPANTDQQKSL